MKRYLYKAKDSKGQLVTGEVEASSEKEAAKLIKTRGLVVFSIKSASTDLMTLINKPRDRITKSNVVDFTRQLATMINAGLPITESLLVLRNQAGSGAMQKMVAQILADVEGGESLSSSLSKHPNNFDTTYLALIKAGELGGVLDNVLLRLAENLERGREFRNRVMAAMIYPIIIIIGMLIVGLGMTMFVIPRLTSLYEEFDAVLPLPTVILVGISTIMINFWPIILLMIAGGIYAFKRYRETTIGRRKTDEMIFKIPLIGNLQRKLILTEVTRTLSLMVSSGVSILEGLNITAEAVNNVVISEALNGAAKDIERGFPIAYAFSRRAEAFPYILSQMVAVGEETGKIDEVLDKVSKVFEAETEQQVKVITSIIEPAIMVVLGIGVAFLIISVILPIYSLTSSI